MLIANPIEPSAHEARRSDRTSRTSGRPPTGQLGRRVAEAVSTSASQCVETWLGAGNIQGFHPTTLYAASQVANSSTQIEQALEASNDLLPLPGR